MLVVEEGGSVIFIGEFRASQVQNVATVFDNAGSIE